jgi:hypothetical protein
MPLFDRVRRGERLRIRADQWNAIVDLADQAQRNQTQFGDADQLAPVRAPNVVLIKNDTNQPVPRFGVLQISGALHDPTNRPDLENEFVTKMALRGTRPDGTSPAIVVALEPIPAGSIGQAAASGVFACKVDVCSSAHRFAVAKGSDIATLQSAPEGPVQILWTANRGRASWTIAVM